ncbi:hypothetical protein [Pontibacter fetidus]|uniref:Uncharacterized protein n=1 Tax=Pontibacter fetidus TaxID=2700082 RepID=A0A6B2H6W8_9BACT|nr:hypothetical protein [Pontibacter fetidus]NDK54992.1 hypothetical protein [Pontibacter fetidus]
MKTLLLLLALVLGLYLALNKARSARSLMTQPADNPALLVGPTQLVYGPTAVTRNV